nr:MAG TPA: hypothetical protein [Caudoviricetes sp.]
MKTSKIMTESFSIEFDGPAFDGHDIPAAALAQSLLALDGLAKRSAQALYGSSTNSELRVKAGFKKGSFIIDLIIEQFQANPLETTAAAVTVTGGVVGVLTGVIKMAKWAMGKKTKPLEEGDEQKEEIKVENEFGQVNVFNVNVVNIYNNSRTQSQLSRLTQTLDLDGAESIKIIDPNAEQGEQEEVITKSDRDILRHEEGIVLTDSESEIILDVIGPMLNGSGKGWTFSDGEIEFVAVVEDADFLKKVKNSEIQMVNGTTIRAIVRTVQKKNVRTRTERTVVEVLEVISP